MKKRDLLVIQEINEQLAIALTCDRDELLCGLARVLLAVGAKDAQSLYGEDFNGEDWLNTTKEFTLEIVQQMAKELQEADHILNQNIN